MFRNVCVAATALCFSAGMSAAQDAAGTFDIELNRALDAGDGVCQIVFKGKNDLGQDLEDVKLRIAVIDGAGVFKNMLALDFGQLRNQKQFVRPYNLPSVCSDISEIIVNEVPSCKLSGSSEDSDLCLNALAVSSRTDIALEI